MNEVIGELHFEHPGDSVLEVRINWFQLVCDTGLLFLKVQVVARGRSVMKQFCWRNCALLPLLSGFLGSYPGELF